MKKINVLVSSAGSTPAISVIKALRKQKELDINIIAIDMGEYSAGFQLANDYCITPASNDSNFIPKIKKICKDKNVLVIIPIIDEELAIFAAEKKVFNDKLGIKVLVNDLEVVKRTNDKWQTYQFCEKNNIRCPHTAKIGINSNENVAQYPGVIKPLNGRGSQDLYFIENEKQLEGLQIGNIKEYIWQERIEGREYTVDILASPEGEILQAIPRERIVVKAGQIFKGKTVKNEKLMSLAKEIAKKFDINGPCNIQFIERNNDFYLIEVNPKFGAGLPLAVEAGVNLPLLLIKMHLGSKTPLDLTPQELDFVDGCYMMRYWEEKYLFSKKKSLS